MTRSLCCLVLTCLVTACVPPKATELVEVPAAPRKPEKPASESAGDSPAGNRRVNPEGMVMPPLENRLPDQRDMTPTAAPTANGGVIATPPPPRKPVNE